MKASEIERLLYILHPLQAIHQNQVELLASATSVEEKQMLSYLLNSGNAVYRYMNGATSYTEADYKEWLGGLEAPMRTHFEKEGFEGAKNVLSFRRYVMEKANVGMDEYMQSVLNEQHWHQWRANKTDRSH